MKGVCYDYFGMYLLCFFYESYIFYDLDKVYSFLIRPSFALCTNTVKRHSFWLSCTLDKETNALLLA